MTVLQALDRYYGRMVARGEAELPGLSREKISFAVVLSAEGEPIDKIDLREINGERMMPVLKDVPAAVRRTVAILPNLFWDKSAYCLGRTVADKSKHTGKQHHAFRTLHLELLAGIDDPALAAFRLFLQRWAPERFDSSPFTPDMLGTNIVFRFDQDEDNFIHERAAARSIIEERRGGRSQRSICLVTGAVAPVRRLHPAIKGVRNAQSSGAQLVSFNQEAFKSYGKDRGDNAPTSEAAAFRYGAALNRMLDRGSRNRIQQSVGDATVVFWADASAVGELAANAAEKVFATIFDLPLGKSNIDDAQEAVKVREVIETCVQGQPIKDIDPRLEPGTRFYVLGLAPNAGRLSVRFWLEDTFDRIFGRLGMHAQDLVIEPKPRGWNRPPSVQRLLVQTIAQQEKFENIPRQLAGEVVRSVLNGLPYPRTLLSTLIMRLRTGGDRGSGWHAALIKACINRALRFRLANGGSSSGSALADRSTQEELPVALEPDKKNVAYQLGRLFAVLEGAQYAALGRVTSSVGACYFASASATPSRVFGPLLRGLKHHVADATKRGRGLWIEARVGEIMLMLPAALPKTLRLEDQGRFAVGYYHERARRRPKHEDIETEGEDNDQ